MDVLFPFPNNMNKSVLPVLPTLTQEDVSTIWEVVSDFIQQQYSLSKGVQIPDLGIFTFVRQRLEIGNNKFIIAKRPMFFLSEKLIQKHGLNQNKVYVPGDIPVVPLNFVTITLQSPFNKDVVEGCIKETLQLLSRSISMQRHVEFTFKGIGVLAIKDDKVKMKFFKDFLHGVDGSGALVYTLANRPYTADSVISITETDKMRPISVLSFPRTDMKESEKKLPMETITEEGEQSKPRTALIKEKSGKNHDRAMFSLKQAPEKVTPTAKDTILSKAEQKESEAKEVKKGRAIAQREKFLKDRIEERISYKRQLDMQVKNNKPFRLPAWVADSEEPIFGKDDGYALMISHQKELECRKHQLKRAASSQRKRVIKGMMDQHRDIQALQNIRKELLEERSVEADRVKSINEDLLDHWGKCVQEKRQREEEAKAFDSATDRLFLLDQCERFQRCQRCQRSLANDGKTHMWPANKFLTGSRVYM
ncbi:coiled-coil domain-containing protein 81 [Sorex fumeus]|uniref:coiled-coil domain-containing protein 81 n=1 Tax=Sorex fumeus TaxID=62283 RepID=UPI0024ADA9CE|nr:coiled-coil domain-containing protein 81 [Sorex fumeus]